MQKVIGAVITAFCCCALMGCGPSAEESAADAEAEVNASSAEAEASASAEARAERAAELEAARSAQGKCQGQLGDFLDALREIDGRLDVGITNPDFGTRLGDVAVSYNAIPFRKLEAECVSGVGVPAENAYNEYVKSQNKWDSCIEDYACSLEGARLKELREHWAKASTLVTRANRALASPKRFM